MCCPIANQLCWHRCCLIDTQLCRHKLFCCHFWLWRHMCCPIATHRCTDTSVDLMPYSAVETQVLSYCHTCMCRHKCSLIATQLCRHVLPCCHTWLYRHKCCPSATHPRWHKCYPIATFGCANTSIVLIFFKNLVNNFLQFNCPEICVLVCVCLCIWIFIVWIYIYVCKWICQRLGSSQVRCTKCILSLLLPHCLCR